jgi:cytochrome b561/polyisoprenoid-binding protein YceI
MTTSRSRYSTVAIVLHWLIAAAIIFQILLGWRMDDHPSPTTYAIFQLHKSVGITILALSLIRLGWRLANPPPPLPAAMPVWEKAAAKATHWGFYAIMLGLPLTGWAIVSTSKTNIPTLLYGLVPWPSLPLLQSLEPVARHSVNKAAAVSHGALVWLTYVLLALHLGAVLKHHFLGRDEVVGHMVPGVRPGRVFEPRLWLVAIAGLAVIAGAYAYGPKSKAPPPSPSPIAAEPAPPAPSPAAPAAATAPAAAAAPTPAKLPLSAWTVAPGGTLAFSTNWGGQPIEGRFETWKADITFSPDDLAGSRLKVTIDVASATTGDAQRDATLSTSDWFDAQAHPKAVFTADSFTRIGDNRYRARGRLQLRGVIAPAVLAFTLTIDGDKARAGGAASVDRTVFGVGQGEMGGTDQIPAAVKVRFDLKATRK